MLYMKRTFLLVQCNCFRSHGALRQLSLWDIRHSLEVVMAAITEVRCSKAEKHRHATAVSALVLQVICAMLRAHLSLADITAAPAHQLLGVESVPDARVQVAPSLSAEVSLAALVTNIVGVALHGEPSWVVVPPRSLSAHRLALGQALVLEPHESLLSHIFMQGLNRIQKVVEGRMHHPHLANWAVGKAKTYPWTAPSRSEHSPAAMQMENVTTGEEYGRNGVERLCKADHAHVVRVLLQLGRLVTAMKAREAGGLIGNATTGMTARVGLATAGRLVLCALLLSADSVHHRQGGARGAATVSTDSRARA